MILHFTTLQLEIVICHICYPQKNIEESCFSANSSFCSSKRSLSLFLHVYMLLCSMHQGQALSFWWKNSLSFFLLPWQGRVILQCMKWYCLRETAMWCILRSKNSEGLVLRKHAWLRLKWGSSDWIESSLLDNLFPKRTQIAWTSRKASGGEELTYV